MTQGNYSGPPAVAFDKLAAKVDELAEEVYALREKVHQLDGETLFSEHRGSILLDVIRPPLKVKQVLKTLVEHLRLDVQYVAPSEQKARIVPKGKKK
jgi:hypothetical protein